MKVSIPVEVHETQYSLVSHGFQTTEFECDHLHIHREKVTGEFFEGELTSEYQGYAYVCDTCDETIETAVVEACNE